MTIITEGDLVDLILKQATNHEYRYMVVIAYGNSSEQLKLIERTVPLLQKTWKELVYFECLAVLSENGESMLSEKFHEIYELVNLPCMLLFRTGICLNDEQLDHRYRCFTLIPGQAGNMFDYISQLLFSKIQGHIMSREKHK